MKVFRIFVFSLLLTSMSSLAQNYYGVNRDLRDNRTPKPPTPEEIEKDRVQYVDKYMVKLKTELTLDELQVIAIKNEILSNSKNIDIIMKKEDSQEVKSKEIKAMMDKTDVVINSYLNKEQKEKYKLFRANVKSKKKDKKNKKDKKDDTSNEEQF